MVIALLVLFVQLAPNKATALALKATRKHSGLTRKKLVLPDGTRYVYLEGGAGVPLMMLHGFGGDKDTFTRVARYLVKRYRLIIPDIVGFGESSHSTTTDYSPVAQAERLRMFAQALQLNNVHLAGNSMGGQIALVYAALYSTEVMSMWLIGPAGIWSASKSHVFNVYAETGRNLLIARDDKEFKEVMALGIFKPPRIPKPMLTVLAKQRIENAALEERIFKQLLAASLEKQIQGLKTATLIMFGERDQVIPLDTADMLRELLPNSKTVLIKNAGHVAMFDQPSRCARQYLLFRESIH